MNPFPPITKVLTLVVQEERQRPVNQGLSLSNDSQILGDSSISIAIASFNSKSKWERPLCSNCGIQGHIVDKCYKLHGYPPSYKTREKSNPPKVQINKTSSYVLDGFGSCPQDSPVNTLTSDQCKQLITLLSSQLQIGSQTLTDTPQLGPSVSSLSSNLSLSLWPTTLQLFLLVHECWILEQRIMFVIF